MNIKPLFDKVVVESVNVEEKTKSGFFLPSSAQEKPQTCIVVAVGPGGIIDGKEIESCGDTCIFMQNGLNPEVDFSTEVIESNGGNGVTDNTAVARYLNKYKNYYGHIKIDTTMRLCDSQAI